MAIVEEWRRLDKHWRCAFRRAWAAYVAGTIPVGAVVVDLSGTIAAEGRNRIFNSEAPPTGQLARSWLAHAELNAIAQIEAKWLTQSEGWAVYPTLEPCPMCAGATIVAFRGHITLGCASGDLGVGGLQVQTETGSGSRRQCQIEKLSGPLAVFAELLHAVYEVEARPTSRQALYYREHPWRSLIDSTGAVIARGRDQGESVAQVLASSWAEMEHAKVDSLVDPIPIKAQSLSEL